eukprot:NODE_2281_length_607_cov_86.691667_g2231_i0.p2 GENE.NODE_2281_length_607_cov_86.691667_g2231_i0~~NODE_2281_length_607_cov_86.691667_g2231_i0.p2  ORF type:complete len:133 (+),score=35.05 NODE_2281_length_607_cov_86.691667_g2231_i0:160-558(+)
MDDVFGDDDVFDSESVVDRHFNAGYLEGIEAGKNESIQEGFNIGFSAGNDYGSQLGVLIGRVRATQQYLAMKGTTSSELNKLLTHLEQDVAAQVSKLYIKSVVAKEPSAEPMLLDLLRKTKESVEAQVAQHV